MDLRSGIPETLTAIAALVELDLTHIDEVCSAFRSIYSRTPAEWGIFPSLFERYFCGRGVQLEEKRRFQPDDLVGGSDSGAGEQADRQTVELYRASSPDIIRTTASVTLCGRTNRS